MGGAASISRENPFSSPLSGEDDNNDFIFGLFCYYNWNMVYATSSPSIVKIIMQSIRDTSIHIAYYINNKIDNLKNKTDNVLEIHSVFINVRNLLKSEYDKLKKEIDDEKMIEALQIQLNDSVMAKDLITGMKTVLRHFYFKPLWICLKKQIEELFEKSTTNLSALDALIDSQNELIDAIISWKCEVSKNA